MIYTKYFSYLLNVNGPFKINANQWKRLMNIVYLEGSIHSLQNIKDSKYPFKHDLIIYKYQQQLDQLTSNQQPADLIKEMYELSCN